MHTLVVIPCYHLVWYNNYMDFYEYVVVVIPCYHLVWYNFLLLNLAYHLVVIPCYHLVWYNREHKSPRTTGIRGDFI